MAKQPGVDWRTLRVNLFELNDNMNNKNIIIIILICVLIVLSAAIITAMQFSQTPASQTINSTNNASDIVNVEKIVPDDEKSNSGSGGTHTEHLIGGEVEVDENGMVVGCYNSKGEYFPGGQLGGMTIEEARAFDERASKYGLT